MTKVKIGITIGDINGIGPEVILKSLANEGITNLVTPIIYGSLQVMNFYKSTIPGMNIRFQVIPNAEQAVAGAVNLINCWKEEAKVEVGQITESAGKYAIQALEKATDDLGKGLIQGLVTAPIHKKAIQIGGADYPGHTEFLAHKFGSRDHLMTLVDDTLRVGLVTGHLPLNKVSSQINKDIILRKINLLNDSLKRDFAIFKPRIAVLGLNPHAGDGGVLGQEEQQHIHPAVTQARSKGIMAFGPFPADGFFGAGTYRNYDAILAMYHDQGLVAFKSMSFMSGVNYTAGLPVVRTSPDHGTGFDIAGKNEADPGSFLQALFAAVSIAKNRANYADMYANPLQKQKLEDDDASNEPDGVVPQN